MTVNKPRILICGTTVWINKEIEDLGNKFDVVRLRSDEKDRDSFFQGFQAGGPYEGSIAIYRTNDSSKIVGVFDKDFVSRLPASVKYICHNGAGYDQVDVHACTEKGIQVSHTPSSVDNATATTGMYLLLSVLRNFSVGEKNAREGKWTSGIAPAFDPEYKTLGIIGMGGIGRAMAKRAAAFEMKIIYYNRNRLSPEEEVVTPDGGRATYCDSMESLLSQSDVVSLNLPLNANTKGIFNASCFSKMKKGAYLVNTARGGVVDEPALLEALDSGHLGGAGLDVFPNEPEINDQLKKSSKVTILPHMGTWTRDTQRIMELQVVDNIVNAIEKGNVINRVAEQKSKI